MTESDQEKLSRWWHNEYNACWYLLDCIRKSLVDTDIIMHLRYDPALTKFHCILDDSNNVGVAWTGWGENIKEAFDEAYNEWRMRE